MQFLLWLERSALGSWVRESSSLWAYPTILFAHTAVDLRMLGFAERLPLAPMERFFSVMWLGFWVNALSGTLLLIADASTKLTNPVFYVKMAFVTLAVVNMVLIRRRVFRDPALDTAPLAGPAKVLAVTSLFFWMGAITAGRLMAYFGPVSGAPGLQNRIP